MCNGYYRAYILTERFNIQKQMIDELNHLKVQKPPTPCFVDCDLQGRNKKIADMS
jgi:hypothetical protein